MKILWSRREKIVPAGRRPSLRLAPLLAAVGLALAIGVGSVGAAARDQPRRDHGRGHWFERSCDQAPDGFAACGADIVSDEQGAPLASGSPPAGALGPAQFATAYNLPSAAGAGKTIAIVDAYDDPNISSDLQTFDQAFGLADLNAYGSGKSPWFRKVNQSGGTTYPSSNSGWALEIALDVETAHGICPSCNILLVEAGSNSFANLGAAENEAVKLGADVVSNSWGGGESSGEHTFYDPYFNHSGVVITVSSGDAGFGAEYPATSPYVVAVGGTTLNLNSSGARASETAWADGGSGCSKYESKPAWQTDSGCSNRTEADVSADADPNTGAAVYDSVPYSGQAGWFQVGGTSLSAPLIAAVFALSGNTSDPAAPYAHAGQLFDVTSGSNGSCSPSYLCNAGPGFDGPTGLGAPQGVAAFQSAPPTPDFSLSVSPSSQAVAPGQNAVYAVTMTPTGGFTDPVDVTVSAAGVSVTPGCTLTTTAPSCNITASSASSGTYTLSVTGTARSGSPTHSTSATLQVSAPDFSLTIAPSSRSLRTPGSTTYTVTVNGTNGFSAGVTLSVTGLPSGVTGVFSTNPATSTSTLTITASKKLSRHTYTFQVTGTSGSLTHSVSGTLSVR
jgi:hypothetical protein